MTYALFNEAEAAERAAHALRDLGLKDDAITLAKREEFERDFSGPAAGPSPDGPVPQSDPNSQMDRDVNKAGIAAAGLGATAIVGGLLLPPLAIIFGAGALSMAAASALGHQSGPAEHSKDYAQYLQGQGLSADTIDMIGGHLTSGGALMQIDEAKEGTLSEAQLLQVVSNHGGRIAWGAINETSPSVANPNL